MSSPHPPLEHILERLAATGRLTHFLLVRSGDRFEASIKRPDGRSYGVGVAGMPVAAALACLAPAYGESWEHHLGTAPEPPRRRLADMLPFDPAAHPFATWMACP